jgi:hypothetical protein
MNIQAILPGFEKGYMLSIRRKLKSRFFRVSEKIFHRDEPCLLFSWGTAKNKNDQSNQEGENPFIHPFLL